MIRLCWRSCWGGSLAHGFAISSDSDIDVAIVLAPAEFQKAQTLRTESYTTNNRTLCTYNGYVDGKYMDEEFLRLVASRGSDPARYAQATLAFCFPELADWRTCSREIARYPTAPSL